MTKKNNQNTRIISPIAIDLGAKYTGVFMTQYSSGEVPILNNMAYTIVLPDDGGKMTWSQIGRTQARHRIRSNKRRKYAKRLLKLIIQDEIKKNCISLEADQWKQFWNCLSGLLNRRGYNRIEAEFDQTSLENADPVILAELLPDYFSSLSSVISQWEELSQDIPRVRSMRDTQLLLLPFNDMKKKIKNDCASKDYGNEQIKQTADALKSLKEGLANIINQLDYGHQHRRDYLEQIKLEMSKDSRLKPLIDSLGLEPVWNIVGNISNLQLRTTRWYFNDKSMKENDLWKPDQLITVLRRWLQYWRPFTQEEKERKRSSLALIDQFTDATQLLKSLDPTWTIPPYEDQDNRRPPKDQTLLLSPTALTQQYGDKWVVWCQKLLSHTPEWSEGVEDILSLFDRKSRLPKTIAGLRVECPSTQEHYKYAVVMQRFLDRSSKLDPYKLRGLARQRPGAASQDAKDALINHLGSQHIDEFLQMASEYFDEVDLAKQGLWLKRESCLLERSDLNPPHKHRIMAKLIGNLLSVKLDDAGLVEFKENLWLAKVRGNSTLRSLSKTVEDTRKDFGNLFNERLRKLRYQIENLNIPEKKVLDLEDKKKIWKAYRASIEAASTIRQYFGHSEQDSNRYSNPFSIAQLYCLLEKDPRGFSSTTLAVHLEQAWRMEAIISKEGDLSARCSRMPADSIRPFDGVLKRLIEHQAHQIAVEKLQQIQAEGAKQCVIDIPILIEENRFSFSEELLELKKAGKAKRDAFKKRLANQSEMWNSKSDRLIRDSHNICPYTGRTIGRYGEADHIVPRSFSNNNAGTIYNSEANLIWCSREGNQQKGDQVYYLHDLKPAYLAAVFGTSDVSIIGSSIEKIIGNVPHDFILDALENDERSAARHALFLQNDSPARLKVMRKLSTQFTARVNGTQAYLARTIIKNLEAMLSDWATHNEVEIRYQAGRINAERVSRIRAQLGDVVPYLKKQEQQSVASHAIDAVCVLAEAAATPALMGVLALGEGLSEDMNWLAQTIPHGIPIRWMERRSIDQKTDIAGQPIFKEGIYGEDFVPIWTVGDKVYLGFDFYNETVQVKGKNPGALVLALSRFLKVAPIKANGAEQPIKLTIDKALAFEHLRKVANEHCTQQQIAEADILESLHFTSVKKDVLSKVYNAQERKFATTAEILDPKAFKIKLSVGNSKVEFAASGAITLPAIQTWKRFSELPELAPLLGKKQDQTPEFRSIVETFFSPGSSRDHQKTRRVFSIPRLEAPSGGFRIRRQAEDGTQVWQTHCIDKSAAKGLSVTDGLIEWNRTVLLDQLRNSKNITPLGGRYESTPDQFVPFDLWLQIQTTNSDVTSIEMAPGTKDRSYIRITQPFEKFKQWIATAVDDIYAHPFELPNQIKINGAKFLDHHQDAVIGKPRSNLFFLALADEVTYWFIVESRNSSMKQAYQVAYSRYYPHRIAENQNETLINT